MRSPNSETPSLVVAALTFKRPEALERLIPVLVDQLASVEDQADGEVLIVDNDPAGSARAAVATFTQAGQPVRYVHEPVPGIATARNRALSASSDRDLLVFIDDDETPSEQWLVNLLGTYRNYRSVGVVGNVLREYEQTPDPWILAGRYFDRDPIATGTRVPAAGTGNLMLDLRQVRAFGVEFDPVFGLSGGSDTLFTRQLVAAGGQLIWCDSAPVVELIPASRLTRKWVVSRAFRIGNGGSRTSLALAATASSRVAVRVKALGGGLARVGGGGLRFLKGKAFKDMSAEARGARSAARGAGMITGAFGYHYDREYRKSRRAVLQAGVE